MLPISIIDLLDLAARHGTPLYVYNLAHVRDRVHELREAVGSDLQISYAVKANPHPSILTAMLSLVDALDVSSAGEIDQAIAAGWPAQRLSFTGPGKRSFELRRALDVGIGEIVIESLDEIDRLVQSGSDTGTDQSVMVRVCPNTVVPGFGSRMGENLHSLESKNI